ncbi:hypothetical protein CRUP_012638 [Coryphaenoides rupestris]|nr:hypothetical protein CRUP_012638 [Coryphaenoides rupestris]
MASSSTGISPTGQKHRLPEVYQQAVLTAQHLESRAASKGDHGCSQQPWLAVSELVGQLGGPHLGVPSSRRSAMVAMVNVRGTDIPVASDRCCSRRRTLLGLTFNMAGLAHTVTN